MKTRLMQTSNPHRAETRGEQPLRVPDPHDLRVLHALVGVSLGGHFARPWIDDPELAVLALRRGEFPARLPSDALNLVAVILKKESDF